MMTLGDRIKAYEAGAESQLLPKLPVIIRIDGKSFHTVTRNLERPYDTRMQLAMAHTTMDLCKAVSGCICGYTQSDEITLVLQNDERLETEPFLSNRVQKLANIAGSMATYFFMENASLQGEDFTEVLVTPAFFDARVFTVPNWSEALNAVIWRQQDATKNAIQMAAQAELKTRLGRKKAQAALHGKNGKEQQELLFRECGINFNSYPTAFKRGIGCAKTDIVQRLEADMPHATWELNWELPILKFNPEAPGTAKDILSTLGKVPP